jgi:hypothetical protein
MEGKAMKICSGGRGTKAHIEIVYDSNHCPLCDYMEDKAGEVADLNDHIKDQDEQIRRLEEKIT